MLTLDSLLVPCVGCGDSHQEAVCQEMVDVVAHAAERCQPGMYATAGSAFESAIGGCDKVVQVRDENILRSECYPFVETAGCNKLMDATAYPAASSGQFLINR